MEPYVLAVDQGTSSTKSLLLDAFGNVVARASVSLSQTHPGPGLVEQDALAILASVREAVTDCLKGIDPRVVAGVALSTQRESVVLWDAQTGTPVAPLVSWQDQRGTEHAERLRRAGMSGEIRRRTGLPLDPMFSALKMAALLDRHDPSRTRSGTGALRLGTVDAFLLHALTGNLVTEIGNASRTQLLNLATGDWDDDLLNLFGIPRAALSEIVASNGPFGGLRALAPLADGTPVLAVMGDSHAALFSHAGWRAGIVKATYGSGSSVMTVADSPTPADHVCSTIAWSTDRTTFAHEANIRSTGRTITWLAELLRTSPDELVALAAGSDAGGVTLVPAFGGIGAPWWDSQAVPVLAGFDLGTGRDQLARAALESVAYQVGDVLAALPGLHQVVADGGLSRSDALMQLQADVNDITVARTAHHDLSAAGAAQLAGLGLGLWTTAELERRADTQLQAFTPSWHKEARHTAVERWHRRLTAARDLGAREMQRTT
ncbi:FGGY family carbohydrate kinase [Streptomyces sp. NPDC055955]|uniref:FGGY family carbohydrate kinase n=1 Tax=Streptomyces sp. NPDC055955 TaxID=3345665 RepID=UPI0035DC40A0